MNVSIPADMNRADLAEKHGAEAVVSIRDLMVLVGATDQQLRDVDEQEEILAREPWRKDGLQTIPCAEWGDWTLGCVVGEIDWSGTRFEGMQRKRFPPA